MEIKEIVEKINNAKFETPYDVEELDGVGGLSVVAEIDHDEHRWYTTAIVVFKTDSGEYIGVRGVVSLKSESSSYSDIGFECIAFEVEQIPSVTYRKKG